MSGHSKWSTIKHKKGAADAKRGKIFTKLIKEITVAARMGGGDIDGNPRLRAAVYTARSANMPGDNIDRAIKKGTGELEGVTYEESSFEGYGPKGAAIIVEVLSDNRNRTVAEIRHLFTRHNGNMGEAGSVSWMFQKKGVITIPKEGVDEDTLMEKALDVGADDVKDEGDIFEVLCVPGDLEGISEALKKAEFAVDTAEVLAVPKTTVKLEGRDAEVMVRLVNGLEDNDDVQHVWHNADIDDAVLEELSG
jgi:YebC/PmpR family DNA-binding regulatory protein